VARHFLIDENLLARHLRPAHGFVAVHVQELGLAGPRLVSARDSAPE